ncbi:MAG: AMIN domain-containing protein [Gammaproteobacteria bacterium]|nr:AMIN domain-containing protein [Gammaproteobacteria bacterium]
MKKAFAIVVPLLLALLGNSVSGQPGAATAQQIKTLRLGITPDHTRVVFDLAQPGSYKLSTLSSPERLVIDFPPGTTGARAHNAVSVQGTPIARIRSGVQPDNSLRFVFDLRSATPARSFTLKPDQGRGNRLVIDLSNPATADQPTVEASTPTTATAQMRRPASITPQDATALPSPVATASGEWSGSLGVQSRVFFQDPAYRPQNRNDISVAFEPQYYIDWANGRQRFAFRPFMRYDAVDDERTHADIRELYWRLESGPWVIKAGIDVVFWGVTESQHLVDIINQTDLVENIDTEDKLGQPMFNLDYFSDWGTWQLYVLPYFRERTFPGEDGRLRTNPAVDTGDPLWESGDEQEHIDFALRWSHYIGDWDIGLAHFTGTSRAPLLVPSYTGFGTTLTPGASPPSSLRPLYQQIDQTSLDVQATKGAWLWKLEAIYNRNTLEDFFASVGGLEFTQYGIGGSAADLGWLVEYHYDERDINLQSTFQNDLFTGLRLTGNDIAGSRLLAGVIVDLDNGSSFGNIEAVRRLGEAWTLTVEARTFFNIDDEDPTLFFEQDDYIEFQLDRFF